VEEDDAVVWRFSSEIWGSRSRAPCSCALPPAASFLISRVGVRACARFRWGDFGDLRPHF
jgi:hypothetical protein